MIYRILLKTLLIICFIFPIKVWNLRAERVQALKCLMNNETEEVIPVYNDISIYPDNNTLFIFSAFGEWEIPLNDILMFSETELEIDLPNLDNPSNEDAGILNLNDFKEKELLIFTLNGLLVFQGKGLPDFSSLEKNKTYIIKQGTMTYKFLKN